MNAKLMFLQCSSTTTAAHRPLLHASTPLKLKISAKLPARDRIITFGKHKGKMLGSLPSNYLEWVSNNLRVRDFLEWAKLADDVLEDPVYRDRIEWEHAERLMSGDFSTRSKSAADDLHEIGERFGWDSDDREGWSKVNFALLGTSRSGRIPRAWGGVREEREVRPKTAKREKVADGFDGVKRRERRERQRMKRNSLIILGFERKFEEKKEKINWVSEDVLETNQDPTVENLSRFPGRDSLLKKVVTSRKKLS